MNVQPAWESGFTGKGVVVTILGTITITTIINIIAMITTIIIIFITFITTIKIIITINITATTITIITSTIISILLTIMMIKMSVIITSSPYLRSSDDGIQYNHPDLKQNYDPHASKDINDGDDDPMPQVEQVEQDHLEDENIG